MSKFEYSTEIGKYGEDVRLSISLEIKDGLTKEDYETLRNAFETIEQIALDYQDKEKIRVKTVR